MANELSTVVASKDLIGEKDIEVLRQSKFREFTKEEINFALSVCGHLALNPLLNQIHFVRRRNKDGSFTVTPQVGIDGFRLVAERTGKYAGSDEPVYEYATGDKLKKIPIKATVTVYKMVGETRCAFVSSARWDEFYPGDTQGTMWRKMPHNQLAKCAEALGLRKAFPAELSGLRTDEEMEQAAKDVGPSKADKLNNPAPVQEAEEVEAEVIEAPRQRAMCCGQPMNVSKFNSNERYCYTCKKKEPI